MTKENDNLIASDNPIASLSHDQKIQFTSSRYLGDLPTSRRNATEAVRTSEFDITERDVNTNGSSR
ncbi:MAG: hypothetical protein VW124_18265 [Paracoccaceae bacterium]|jgi:hypothetical protein